MHETLKYGNKVYPTLKQSFRTDNSKVMHHIHYHLVLTAVLCLKHHKYLPKKIILKFGSFVSHFSPNIYFF